MKEQIESQSIDTKIHKKSFLHGIDFQYESIGNLISRIREKGKRDNNIKTVYAVSNILGLVKAEDFRDNTIHSSDTSNYTIVMPDMFAYNPARLNIGSIGYLKKDLPGLVSPMYVVFKIDEKRIIKEYLHLFIKSKYCINKINSLTESGARFRFDFERWKLIQIPIPPLAVQKEIVRILDTFSELTAELTAELSARKKQYSFYREQFLNFKEDEVEWKRLGEVITLQRGKRLVKSQLEETGEYAVYQNAMTPLGYYHESNVIANTTFVICAGAAGEIGFSDVPYWAADDVHSCRTPDGINNKYLYYYLQTQQHKISSQVRRASVPRLSKGVLNKLKFPIPSLEAQNRIVSILDKFDILTNSLCEGLPKEIELRKKQYEYYRDMLLTFPKQESV